MAIKTRKEAEAQIIGKAETDAAFRKQLIADPRAVVSRELGVELPASFKISVFEENDNSACLVLPPFAAPGGELADDDLEQVAGGANQAGGKRPISAQKIAPEGAAHVANVGNIASVKT